MAAQFTLLVKFAVVTVMKAHAEDEQPGWPAALAPLLTDTDTGGGGVVADHWTDFVDRPGSPLGWPVSVTVAVNVTVVLQLAT